MSPSWEISRIERRHERASFDCGEQHLNDYLRRFARQNQEQDIVRTWVACEPGVLRVLGFYTLSASSIAFEHVPEAERKRLPQYPIPVAHLGRIAVDLAARGQGLGETLLIHALEQVERVSQTVAIRAVEVRVKDATARRW